MGQFSNPPFVRAWFGKIILKIRKLRASDFKQIKNIHDLYALDVEALADPDYQAKTQKEGFTASTGKTNLSQINPFTRFLPKSIISRESKSEGF